MESISHEAGASPDLRKARRVKRSLVDRLPPSSAENEQGVLGCCLLDPATCINTCAEKFKSSEVFYDMRHREIYETMIAMTNLGIPVDLISLQQWLKDNGVLEQVGGIAYLSQLQDVVPSAANLSHYLSVVADKFLLRRVIQVCTDVVGRVYDYEGNVESILGDVERDILAIRPKTSTESTDVKSLVKEALSKIESLFESKGVITGIPTGLVDLDMMTDGLHRGEMVVIAAYPGDGKSAMASGIAIKSALANISAGVFSLEMRPAQIVVRGISSESKVNLYDVRRGNVAEHQFARMTSAALGISKSPLHVENANGMTISQLTAAARRMKQMHDIQILVVDYLQLLSCPGCDSREQEVSKISKGIKSIAMELGIPVLALSQLNDDGKLRESRAIGQDADSVWKIEPDGERHPLVQPVKLVITKSRDGEVGTVKLTFLKTILHFESASKIDDSDVPTDR